MRGDVTNNSAELLACFFARYLPEIGRRPGQGLRGVVDATTSGSSTEADVQMTDSMAPTTNGQTSEQEEDELTKLRRARLAAFGAAPGHQPVVIEAAQLKLFILISQ